jgi:hypothetical protein
MNNTTNTNKLSLQHPDSISSIYDTQPPTPVLNPTLLNTKHLSVDIHTWNNFNETDNQIPTMDVSPIYANTPHTKKMVSKTNDIVQKQTIKRDQEHKTYNYNDYTDDRSCLMKMLIYLFAPDYL